MKHLLLILCFSVVASACSSDDGGGRLDPDAMVALNAAPEGKADGVGGTKTGRLTAKEVVEQASVMSFWNDARNPNKAMARGFADHQRDTANNRLLMYGTDVIAQRGYLTTVFIEGRDFIFEIFDVENHPIDTIAYIPNAIIRAAEAQIKEAYARGDYATCYRVMDEAYQFTPITGEEWRALKKAGNN